MGRYPLSGSIFQREQKPHQGNMKEYLVPFLEAFHNISLIIFNKIKPFTLSLCHFPKKIFS